MELLVRLGKSEVNAAAAVLRGYLQHQRERLGERAEENPNFRLVSAALAALEQALAAASSSEEPPRDQP